MNLLSALIALSFLITTFISCEELFLKSDKRIRFQQEQFVSLTKKQLKKGSISLVGASLGAFLSAMLLFYVYRMKIEYREAQYRQKSYLCFLHLNQQTTKYVRLVAQMNSALRTLFILKHSSLENATIKTMYESVVSARNIIHYNYLKELASNPFCHYPETRNYYNQFPYLLKNHIELDTNIDQTSRLRSPQWNTLVYLVPRGIRIQNSFCLKAYFQMTNPFSQLKLIRTEEEAWTGLGKLKCSSG